MSLRWYHVFGLRKYSADWKRNEVIPELEDVAETARDLGAIIRKNVALALSSDDLDYIKDLLNEIDSCGSELEDLSSENAHIVSKFQDDLVEHSEEMLKNALLSVNHFKQLKKTLDRYGVVKEVSDCTNINCLTNHGKERLTSQLEHLEETLDNFIKYEDLHTMLLQHGWPDYLRKILAEFIPDLVLTLDTTEAMFIMNRVEYYTYSNDAKLTLKFEGDQIRIRIAKESLIIYASGLMRIISLPQETCNEARKMRRYDLHKMKDYFMNPLLPTEDECLVYAMVDNQGYDYKFMADIAAKLLVTKHTAC